MHFLPVPAILAVLVSLTLALPAASPVQLVPRACSTLAPGPVVQLDSANPNTIESTGQFGLNRTGGAPYQDTVDTVLTFNYIPDGATGCTLRFTLPALTTANEIAYASPDYSGGFQADVWTVAPDPLGFSTWNRPPTRSQLVSTVIFPTGTTTDVYQTNVWSGTCPQGGASTGHPYGGTLSFLFEASTWQQLSGGVRFYNTLGGKQGLEPIGFSLVFNC